MFSKGSEKSAAGSSPTRRGPPGAPGPPHPEKGSETPGFDTIASDTEPQALETFSFALGFLIVADFQGCVMTGTSCLAPGVVGWGGVLVLVALEVPSLGFPLGSPWSFPWISLRFSLGLPLDVLGIFPCIAEPGLLHQDCCARAV